MGKKKVALISLGCAKNLVDSEVMLGYLKKSGMLFVPSPEEADIIIINTCGFIQPAKREAESWIEKALSIKGENQSIKVIITGCYVERDKKALERLYPDVDAWLGVKDFDKIAPVVHGQSFKKSRRTFLYSHDSPRIVSTSPSWAYIKISEGCSHRCAFCTIPLIKGSYRSRKIDSIKREVEILASKGIQEINLVSQDTTFFGRDKGQKNALSRLLRTLAGMPDVRWIRLLYGYPEEVTDDLLDLMQEDKICPYLDIPFQHSHPRIISSMKRGLDSLKALKLLEKIRRVLPDVAIRTSLIVGYPLEGEKEFDHLLEFVKQARFTHLGIFTYWQEKGTEAYSLGDPVPVQVKEQRTQKIMEAQSEISYELNARYLHQTIDTIIERPLPGKKKEWAGRGRHQAPEVDGLVKISGFREELPFKEPIRKVEIRKRDVYDLYGVLKS